ncbi:NADH:ubiquinone oxidoreductase [Xylographa opegraphella]|nr:NADH:ubiquinone oxidoreductase [Xylographa opegraphella]
MSSPDHPASSPPTAITSQEDALTYYKSQYEQLEAELADFQASSRDLEAELEKDVEAAEKRERQLQEKVESLSFEVEEWKSKCKQSKAEANSAQNTLQKEITSLRDSNRTLQLKLRDIEVANDDFEKQARNTTSSLEDLESKYNVAIERGVIFEEEIKAGEQEREALRIETQRLRDELSDLKVEAEIRQDKLRYAEAASDRQRLRKPTPIGTSNSRPQSSISEHSPSTTTSSPTVATPPTKSASSGASDTPTPPSPPVSDRSLSHAGNTSAYPSKSSRLSIPGPSVLPRGGHFSGRAPRHSRGPSVSTTSGFSTPQVGRRTTLTRPKSRQSLQPPQSLPSSTSLTQIRGLIGKMQKLEQRVQSARSKLPAPTATPPGTSPRSGSALGQSFIPATVTVRSQKKRNAGSIAGNVPSSLRYAQGTSDLTPTPVQHDRKPEMLPPPSTMDIWQMGTGNSRPSSRASLSSRQSMDHLSNARASAMSGSRPSSRQSMSISGARTPQGHYSNSTASSETRARPRSTIGGSYASLHSHGYSASVSQLGSYNSEESFDGGDLSTPTPSRRTTLSKEGSSIPIPGYTSKRQSGTGLGLGRRISSGQGMGDMGPPLDRTRPGAKKLTGVGETY